jgi:hypothetical protein
MKIPVVPALVVAASLVVLSAGTGAVAGALVTSADIKNGTVKLADLNKKTVKALRGRTGPAGAPGSPGANGSARAYAAVAPDGRVDAGRSQGLVLTSALDSGGYYCFNDTTGAAHVVVATVDDSGNQHLNSVVTATTDPAWVSLICADPGSDILVQTVDHAGTNQDTPFYLAVIS